MMDVHNDLCWLEQSIVRDIMTEFVTISPSGKHFAILYDQIVKIWILDD